MALRFDPAAIMAPGGIASGLDNMGAAVMNALNRRAERKYALEAEQRRRQMQLEDQTSERGYRTSERIAGQEYGKAMQDDTQLQQTALADKQDNQQWTHELRTSAQAVAKDIADLDAPVSEPFYDDATAKWITRPRALTPEERQARLDAIDFKVEQHTKQFSNADLADAWAARKSKAQPKVSTGTPPPAPPQDKWVPTPATVTVLAQRPMGEKLGKPDAVNEAQADSNAWSVNNLTGGNGWWNLVPGAGLTRWALGMNDASTPEFKAPALIAPAPSGFTRKATMQLAQGAEHSPAAANELGGRPLEQQATAGVASKIAAPAAKYTAAQEALIQTLILEGNSRDDAIVALGLSQ